MTDKTQTPATLVEALERFEDSTEGRQAVLQHLLRSRVFVLLDKPWDGRSLPNTETRLLYVSDGDDKQQAMLALFTDRAKAEQVMPAMGEFRYAVEVDAPWALLSLAPNTGVRINPNLEPAFRILPQLALEVRKLVEQNQAMRRSQAGSK
ncbi:MAG TPA: SseB family protein [Gammaproteobacteria bacterium]|jgi:hypothetical protein